MDDKYFPAWQAKERSQNKIGEQVVQQLERMFGYMYGRIDGGYQDLRWHLGNDYPISVMEEIQRRLRALGYSADIDGEHDQNSRWIPHLFIDWSQAEKPQQKPIIIEDPVPTEVFTHSLLVHESLQEIALPTPTSPKPKKKNIWPFNRSEAS